ncbi:hypothetical protein C810_01478 [Lachnospiraceae bacterium A2]|nr:hypothetical protein C810_01478 [Lachnospiraceae bacterium A2]
MRILSWNKVVDMPYELVALSVSYKIFKSTVDKNVFCVNAHSNSLDAKRVIMGEYSSEEKAKKALEMLNNAYQYAEECKYTGVGATQPEFVFVFPADDEVEV